MCYAQEPGYRGSKMEVLVLFQTFSIRGSNRAQFGLVALFVYCNPLLARCNVNSKGSELLSLLLCPPAPFRAVTDILRP